MEKIVGEFYMLFYDKCFVIFDVFRKTGLFGWL